MPAFEEDVVFRVESGDVFDVGAAELGSHGLFDGVGESDGREDGKGAGGEFNDCSSAAYLDATEAGEGCAAGEDAWV